MSSDVSVSEQHLVISSVRAVVVTEIVPVDGGFTRAVRFFGEPLVNGAPRLILDVTVTAADKASLEVSTPVLQF